MKTELVRFGVAMESALLEQFDAIVEQRKTTRSEVLRDLVRAELVKSHVARGVDAAATVTVVYRQRSVEVHERITALQAELGDRIRCTVHVPLSVHYTLSVLVLQGTSDEIRAHAEQLLGTKGVKHGGIEMVTDITKHAGHAAVAGA
jgi:CopG family transcriptional regulator, nickel-responsive regulator